jgi:hypothetical protein
VFELNQEVRKEQINVLSTIKEEKEKGNLKIKILEENVRSKEKQVLKLEDELALSSKSMHTLFHFVQVKTGYFFALGLQFLEENEVKLNKLRTEIESKNHEFQNFNLKLERKVKRYISPLFCQSILMLHLHLVSFETF